MADQLTTDERAALIEAFGTVDNAIDEALRRSPEVRALWETYQQTTVWWRHENDFWMVFWTQALPVLGIDVGPALFDDHPEVGPGLEVARGSGVADLDDDGEWVVGDLSRL